MNWDFESHLPPGVAENLGYYVYLYIDPRTGEPFYVGKGKTEFQLFGQVHGADRMGLSSRTRLMIRTSERHQTLQVDSLTIVRCKCILIFIQSQ